MGQSLKVIQKNKFKICVYCEYTTMVIERGRKLTQLLVRCKDEAFARKYIQYPFVATNMKNQIKKLPN